MSISKLKFNKPPFCNFVHPHICKDLTLCGLTTTTHFDWYIRNNVVELVTFYWDADDYYYEAQKQIINVVNKPTILPAYTLSMMMELIPGPYSLIRDGMQCYELAIDNIWNCSEEKDVRLPDVFAKMVLQLYRKRILTANDCNAKIAQLIQ